MTISRWIPCPSAVDQDRYWQSHWSTNVHERRYRRSAARTRCGFHLPKCRIRTFFGPMRPSVPARCISMIRSHRAGTVDATRRRRGYGCAGRVEHLLHVRYAAVRVDDVLEAIPYLPARGDEAVVGVDDHQAGRIRVVVHERPSSAPPGGGAIPLLDDLLRLLLDKACAQNWAIAQPSRAITADRTDCPK